MKNIKAKLTTLLMTVCCSLACLGVGFAMQKPTNEVTANAATAEELTAEFTNNGQFTLNQFREDMPFEVVDSTTEGVPEGASGAVLKITGVGDDGTSAGGAFVTLDFLASKIVYTGVDIVVRVYQPDTKEFRVSQKAGSAEWKTTVKPAAGWSEVTLSASTNASEDHQWMKTISMGYRRGTECYIDSITVVDNALKQEFTNNGQFDMNLHVINNSDGSTTVIRSGYVDGSTVGLPEGYEGAVYKIWNTGTQYAVLDFSGSGLKPADIESISAKCYLTNAYTNKDASKTYTDANYEFRLNNVEKTAGGVGAYDMSTWFTAPIDVSKISTDANGYLTTVSIGLRNKGNTSENGYLYIDKIDVVTKSYTTIDLGKVVLAGSSVSAPATNRLYLKSASGVKLGEENIGLLCQAESGTGFLVDDAAFSDGYTEMLRVSDNSIFRFYIEKISVVVGTKITVGGTFVNETNQVKYVIEDNSFWWNGTAWTTEKVDKLEEDEYMVYDFGALLVHSNSSGMSTNKPASTAIYMKTASGTLPIKDWNSRFALESGAGWKVNGESVELSQMVSTDAGLYNNLASANIQVGDVLSVEGTFTYEDKKVQYVIAESKFVWNGTAWEDYVAEYTTHTLGEMAFNSWTVGSNFLYLKNADKKAWPGLPNDGNSGWTATFLPKDGVGVTLNGEPVMVGGQIKFPSAMFINLQKAIPQNQTPVVGDKLVVGGTFYNTSLALQYVVGETSFTWDGTTWVKDITTYTVTKIGSTKDSSAKALYLYTVEGDALPKSRGDWQNVYTAQDGASVTLNGEAINPQIKLPGDLYFSLGKDAVAGDVVTINGTFYNSNRAINLVFDNCQLQFNGTKWVEYVPPAYTVYTLGKLGVHNNSNGMTTNKPAATAIYMKRWDETKIPIEDGDWNAKFALESGDGWKLNGNPIEFGALVSSNSGLYINVGSANVKVGDVLTVSGTFTYEAEKVKYIIEESSFVWNGTAWEEKVEYETQEVGSLLFNSWTTDQNHIYLVRADGQKYAVPQDGNGGWSANFFAKDGVGITYNGKTLKAGVMKMPNVMFINLDSVVPQNTAPAIGDVLTVGGTFYNTGSARKDDGTYVYFQPVQYVVTETSFTWNGETWVLQGAEPEYAEYDLGGLKIDTMDGNNVFFNSVNNVDIPVDEAWLAYTCIDGVGATLNGDPVAAVRFSEGVCIELTGTPAWGDKLVIGGTFENEEALQRFTITETTFWWNGQVWGTSEPIKYTDYELGYLVVHSPSAAVSSAKATQLYIKKADGTALPYPDKNWNTEFIYESGIGIRLNGTPITIPDLESTNENLFLQLANAGVQVGDMITIGGTFVCPDAATENGIEAARYIIKESSFIWNGKTWVSHISEDLLENYDLVSLYDIGLPMEWNISGTVDKAGGLSFNASEGNSTNSVAVRFGINCTNFNQTYIIKNADGTEQTAASNLAFRLCGSNWQGVQFHFRHGAVWMYDANKSYTLENNTDYLMELGAVMMKDGRIWTYVKVDGILVLSEAITSSQFKEFSNYATTGFTTHISVYAAGVAEMTLKDAGNVAVTYVSSAGESVVLGQQGDMYTLPAGKSTTNKVFLGWIAEDGKLYEAGSTFQLTQATTFTALEVGFYMEDGASIRLANTADESGIRFTTYLNAADLNKILGNYGITTVKYGTLIMPYDYLSTKQKPNLEDFNPEEEEILKIESTATTVTEGFVAYRGAMQNLYMENYGRLFAGRSYMEITFADGVVWTVYSAFDNDNNVRSIRQVAQAFKMDTDEYNSKVTTEEMAAVVDAYAKSDDIHLMPYERYEANSVPVIAWNYPALDPSNGYMNDSNIAIATKMKEAGIAIVGLTGANLVFPNSGQSIEKTRSIIKFFWSQGLYTFAFAANTGGLKDDGSYNNMNCDLSELGYPDFSDCEGFIGYLAWDEPSNSQTVMDKIAAFAQDFEKKYAGTDVIFMTNLLPSYASYFKKSSTSDAWNEAKGETSYLDQTAFKNYLQQYCDTVLSQVSGTKWLSLDTYPILEDGSLVENFLFDLGALKVAAMKNDAHAHVVLQSSGWVEGGNTDKSRIPTEAELRMQMYAAMAFGIDSMSWFTYSPSGVDGSNTYNTFVDNNGNIVDQAGYEAFTKVNAEFNAISSVYGAFDWKGVILGTGTNNSKTALLSNNRERDKDYKAFAAVTGQLGEYELAATDTKHLASVSTNKTDWNYLMGVMEDANGNEGYVLCNYNSHEENRAQTITLTFDSNVTEVVIYRGGEAETVSVTNKTLTVSLATGEGVIILPSKLG